MKKIGKTIPLCLCTALLFAMAACGRGLATQDIKDVNFVPGGATILEATPAYLILEARDAKLEDVIEHYRWALLLVEAQEITLEDTVENYWSYSGFYIGDSGDERTVTISLRDIGGNIQILVSFVDEMKNAGTTADATPGCG